MIWFVVVCLSKRNWREPYQLVISTSWDKYRIPYFWCWMIWNSSGLLYNVQTMPRFWIKSTVSIIMRRDRMCRDEKQTDAPPTLWSSLMMDRSLKQKKTTTSHLFLRLLSWKIVDAAMTTHKEKIQNICRYIFYTRQETIDATNFFTRKKVFFFFFFNFKYYLMSIIVGGAWKTFSTWWWFRNPPAIFYLFISAGHGG